MKVGKPVLNRPIKDAFWRLALTSTSVEKWFVLSSFWANSRLPRLLLSFPFPPSLPLGPVREGFLFRHKEKGKIIPPAKLVHQVMLLGLFPGY